MISNPLRLPWPDRHSYKEYELSAKTIDHVKRCPDCRVVGSGSGKSIELCSVGDGIEQSIRKESL